jgi:hypothetical protein
VKTYGLRVAFGWRPDWIDCPISNLPADTLRVWRRIRAGEIARAFVRRPGAVEKWMLAPDGERSLKLLILEGVNVCPTLSSNVCERS